MKYCPFCGEELQREEEFKMSDPFEEEYFSNFDVGLDLDEEGYRVLASKIIVEEVESEDHQIALAEVMQVAEDAQIGDTVVLDVTPEKDKS